MPLHVVDGIGDPLGWLRDPLPVREAALRLANAPAVVCSREFDPGHAAL
jgi:hypothetical protein